MKKADSQEGVSAVGPDLEAVILLTGVIVMILCQVYF